LGKLREGKSVVQAILKDETVKKLDGIANNELTSRSAIAGKIIEENIQKYVKEETKKPAISYTKIVRKDKE